MIKKFILPLVFFLLTSFIYQSTSVNGFSSDTTELNWYYRASKEKGKIPDGPKESASFLKDYDAYFLGDTSNKVLYLTFDEGYEKGYTGQILDTLKELEVPAAFFVVKPYIKEQPDLIKRMVDEGHLVCNHSNHHPSMASITNTEKFNKELTDVEEYFKEVTGQDMPKFFRPPMGKYSKDSLDKTKALGYKTIFWSFAYKDWLTDYQPSESFAIKKIENGVHPGGIILLHAVSETNTKVLKTVLTDLKNEGYEFKSLNDLPETTK
ncbi:MAG: delta-lactam-biosynthetic de-N-acetylase [Clostridium sp.]|nr:delta-lactam-biosynthetic de-N-acetylase [Clostridium sp.]